MTEPNPVSSPCPSLDGSSIEERAGTETETTILPQVIEPLETLPDDGISIEEEIQAEAEHADTGSILGTFITFEGCEGSGKTTQIAHAIEWLQAEGIPFLATHEPGGTPLGQTLRSLLLSNEEAGFCTLAELFLLLADRAQHVSEVIRPSLAEGLVVLCDRYNDSTLAYQARSGGLDELAVRESCSLATEGLQPDLTILLDIDPAVAFQRLHREFDRMEKRGPAFHQQVQQAFLELAQEEPHRFVVIDGSQPEDDVAHQVKEAIRNVLKR